MEITRKDAFLVVDAQNDFCPGGSLAVEDADAILPVINRLLGRFETRVFTRDWHPPDHVSFDEDPAFRDESWPPHCVAGTPGAEFRPGLEVPDDAIIVSKATEPDKDAYSGFDGTDLAETLRAKGVTRVFVAGLATDYCVKNTVFDALRLGFDAIVVEDAIRGVDNPPGTAAEAVAEMKNAGADFVLSEDL
jgi:nicotinamidase/pyrazinamidase